MQITVILAVFHKFLSLNNKMKQYNVESSLCGKPLHVILYFVTKKYNLRKIWKN